MASQGRLLGATGPHGPWVWAGSRQHDPARWGAWAAQLHLLEPSCFPGRSGPQNSWGRANPRSFPLAFRRKDGIGVSPHSPQTSSGGA